MRSIGSSTLPMIFSCSLMITACMSKNGTVTITPNVITPDVRTNEISAITQGAASARILSTKIPIAAGYGTRVSDIDIYFTNPNHPLASQTTGGLDGPLVDAIDNARLSIDLAIFSLSLENVGTALV